jgi:iron uptake system component EfeO
MSALLLAGCGSSSSGGADESSVAKAMQESLKADLMTLHTAAVSLQAAAPTPSGRGWDATMDATAIAAMKTAWIQARTTYERIEGAIAPIFPDADIAIDERYDGFLAGIGPQGDANLFDGQGVTGMHAIERVLYADVIPARVVTFEMSLPGYKAAAFPATEAEAAEFKSGLAAQLVTDTQTLLTNWDAAVKLDVSGAFQGLIGLMNEQQEKVNNAASGEEESRYSQRTMADLHANLAGTKAIYTLFREWLQSKPSAGSVPAGKAVDGQIMGGFGSLEGTYATITGDAIPAPPATWSAEMPSAADLQTPFGQLYQAIHQAVDPKQMDSVVQNMNEGAMLLGIPGFEG